jgi:hypothetical protein
MRPVLWQRRSPTASAAGATSARHIEELLWAPVARNTRDDALGIS